MTTAALLTAARKLDAAAVDWRVKETEWEGDYIVNGKGYVVNADEILEYIRTLESRRTLLPQLADALEVAERSAKAWEETAHLHATNEGDLKARLAKVLPLAIDTIQVVRGGEWVGGKRCRSCYAEWADGYTSQGHAYNEPRTCAPDCPARPMEDA